MNLNYFIHFRSFPCETKFWTQKKKSHKLLWCGYKIQNVLKPKNEITRFMSIKTQLLNFICLPLGTHNKCFIFVKLELVLNLNKINNSWHITDEKEWSFYVRTKTNFKWDKPKNSWNKSCFSSKHGFWIFLKNAWHMF